MHFLGDKSKPKRIIQVKTTQQGIKKQKPDAQNKIAQKPSLWFNTFVSEEIFGLQLAKF